MANQFRVRKGLIVNGSGSTLLDVQGSQGQLFSVTDSLSGSLFAAKDISGIPVIEAFSDNRVNIGTFNQEAIKVSGSFAFLTGSLRGTASWAENSRTASLATTASFAVTASFFSGSISNATLAATASFVTASNVWGPFGSNSILSSSYALTASFAATASYGINIVISGSVNNADYIQFNTTASVTDAVGRLYYNSGEGTLNVGLVGGNVIANIGEDLYQYVYNSTGAPLTKGQVVYISGSQGNRIAVKLASATAEQGSANTLGFVAEPIAAGSEGWIQTEGVMRKLNTTGLVGGGLIYLSSSAGQYTQIKQQAPLHEVRLGYAERIDATVGSIYIKIDNGYELDELHNVFISGSSSGDLLTLSGSLWVNSKQLTGSYGLTGSLALDLLQLNPGQDPGTANISASYFFVSASGDNREQNLHFRNNGALWEMHWLEQVTNTGIVWGGVVTFTSSLTDTPPNRTQLRITPGAGLIVNHNANTGSHGDTVPTYVEFGPITASAEFITSSQVTYLLIDENGQLIQQTTQFTSEQYVEKFPLGYIFSLTTSSISSYADARVTTYGQVEQQSEFVRAFGPLKLSGYDITAQTGSLKISIAAGQSYRYGGFYTQNPQSPSIYDSPAIATGSLVRVYRDPSVTGGFRAQTNAGLPFTDIDPTKWDDGSGTLQTVGNDEWTIQRVFEGVVNSVSYVYYGQNKYSSLALALQSITTDEFVESPTSILALPFIGYIITRGNTTDIGDTTNNRIIQAGLFRNTAGSSGGGGAAAQNLNDLSDVTILSPTNGQALVYDSGLWVNGAPVTASYSVTASFALNSVAGTSGTSGLTGTAGTSGANGTSGITGTSGTSGTSGANGTSGTSGTRGSSGSSGSSGTSGVNGTSGTSGANGTSGVSGTSGTSGLTGTSGTSGLSGTSGTSGANGTSGTSGLTGTSGTSGANGTSGTSGIAGTAGTSGLTGTAGTSGLTGTAGTSGLTGTSGTSGANGTSGTSGIAGTSGTSGLTGTSGTSGANGTSGTSGLTGTAGTSGLTGTAGTSGLTGTSGTSGANGANGTAGTSGITGTSGTSGITGTAGTSGLTGTAGTSGLTGTSGTSGLTGTSGTSGANGTSGTSGITGTSGTSGITGTAGTSGLTGTAGTSGASPTGQIILTAAGSWPSITGGASAPIQAETTTNDVNYYYVSFVDGSTTYCNWALAMPSDYDGGTITAVFYWTTPVNSTNSVVWGLAGRAFDDGDLFDQAFGTVQTVTDANNTGIEYVNISAATPAITLGGTPAASQYVQFRAERQGGAGGDTLLGVAELLQVRITYTRA